MTELRQDGLESFLRQLEEALGRGGRQRERIVAEVRGDLETHVERLQAEGHSEEEAVSAALAVMGNPYELAHHMRAEIPPFAGRAVTVLRNVLAVGVAAWAVLLLWQLRAWTYGFTGAPLILGLLLHLPVILLLWPRIVWRPNWMFSLVPAGLGLAGVAILMSLGQAEEAVAVPLEAGAVEAGEIPAASFDSGESGPRWGVLAVLGVGLGVTLVLLLRAMQQRRQRWVAIVAVVLVAAGVEGGFQAEEWRFRKDLEVISEFMDRSYREAGVYPDGEVVLEKLPGLRSSKVRLWSNDDGYNLFWGRPLSSGFSITYSSDDGAIGIQD